MMSLARNHELPTQAEFHRAIANRGDHWFAACLRITRNEDLAADAVQDALLSAWNKRHQFERTAQLETWIHRIAINAALQLLRKAPSFGHEGLDEDLPDAGLQPDAQRAEQELGTGLASALRHLSDMERTCFVLKHLEQWRLNEIAFELDISVNTVKQALFRAVKKLRVILADRRSNHDY